MRIPEPYLENGSSDEAHCHKNGKNCVEILAKQLGIFELYANSNSKN